MTPALNLAIQLLIAVESMGNPRAINTKEQAVGILQIRPIMVEDVNRILELTKRPERFTEDDRWDPTKSIQMAEVYLSHYGTVKRIGHEPTLRDYALLWCAGPDGPTQAVNESMANYLAQLKHRAKQYAQFVKLDPTADALKKI